MVSPFFISIEIGLQIVRKEKELQDGKHDKQLNENNEPQPLTHRHAAKTIPVKIENALN